MLLLSTKTLKILQTISLEKIAEYFNLNKNTELSEDAQNKALTNHFDINVDYEWWESTYEDAKNVGIEINSFDIDRASYCRGKIYDTEQTAHDIIKNHGEQCDTYKTAANYLKTRDELIANWPKDENGDYTGEDDLDTELDRLGEEFEDSIFEDYKLILTHEYDYLTSKDVIIETLEANDYDFTEDGKMY